MTVAKLAEVAGFNESTISQIERGRINYTAVSLNAIADALDTEPGRLLLGPPEELVVQVKALKQWRDNTVHDTTNRISIEQTLEAFLIELNTQIAAFHYQQIEALEAQSPKRRKKVVHRLSTGDETAG